MIQIGDDDMEENMEKHFTSIYNPKPINSYTYLSTGGETVCGRGSMRKNNVHFLDYLQSIVNDFNVKTIVDVGCGDLNYISPFLRKNPQIDYTGIDISKPLIERNKQMFPDFNFEHHNICESFPTQNFDLCIIKEVFIHISPRMVSKTLGRIKQQNNVKHLLITGHTQECQLDGGLGGDKDSDYGNFSYHFTSLDNDYLSEMVDCDVRLSRLYSIDSIIEEN